MKESDFTRAVISLCQWRHLFVAHFRPAQTKSGKWVTAVQGNGKGYPDLTIVGSSVLWAELKLDHTYLEPAQKEWKTRLEAAGALHVVWKPKHLNDGTIAYWLDKIADPRWVAPDVVLPRRPLDDVSVAEAVANAG